MLKKLIITILMVILLGITGVYFYANWEAKRQANFLVDQALASGSYAELSYESIDVNLLSRELTLKNLRIVDLQQTEIILRQVIVSDYDYLNEIPHHLNLSMKGISLPKGLPTTRVTTGNALALYVESLTENDTLPLEVNYSYIFDEEDNMHLKSTMGISLHNALDLSFESSIKNIPLDSLAVDETLPLEQTQDALLNILLKAEIPNVSLSIKDLGIVNAIFAIQADENDLPAETVQQQLILTTQNLYIFAPAPLQQIVLELSQELAGFLEGNKILNISMEPEFEGKLQSLQPQIFGALFTGDYEAIYNMLNVKISADAIN